MDKSVKKILEHLNNQIDSNELTAALKADNFAGEYALSEDGLAAILTQTSELLTVESAVANAAVIEKINKESYPKHMKSALGKVETKLKPIYDKLGIDYSDAEFLSDKIDDIETKIASLSESGDNKELIESLNRDLRSAKEENETQKKTLTDEFELKYKESENNYQAQRLSDKFSLTADEYTWAEVYSKPALKKAILGTIRASIDAKAHLKLSEDGSILVKQKDMPDKDLFNGNKVETFQSLLEPELEPYLKKSSPEKVHKDDTKVEKPELSDTKQAMINQRAKFMES